MKKYKLLIVSLLLFSFGVNRVNANIICNDGTVSKSCSTCSKGCCSRHGGCSNDTIDYTPPSNNSGTNNNNKIVDDKKEEVKEEPKIEEKIEEVETTNEVQEEEKILEETDPEIKEEIVDEIIEEEVIEEKEDIEEEDLYYESKRQEGINKSETNSVTSFLSVAAILGVGGLIYYKKNAKKEESKNIIDILFNRKKKSKLDKIKDLFK